MDTVTTRDACEQQVRDLSLPLANNNDNNNKNTSASNNKCNNLLSCSALPIICQYFSTLQTYVTVTQLLSKKASASFRVTLDKCPGLTLCISDETLTEEASSSAARFINLNLHRLATLSFIDFRWDVRPLLLEVPNVRNIKQATFVRVRKLVNARGLGECCPNAEMLGAVKSGGSISSARLLKNAVLARHSLQCLVLDHYDNTVHGSLVRTLRGWFHKLTEGKEDEWVFPRVHTLSLINCSLNDLQVLRFFPALTTLFLGGCKVSPPELEEVEEEEKVAASYHSQQTWMERRLAERIRTTIALIDEHRSGPFIPPLAPLPGEVKRSATSVPAVRRMAPNAIPPWPKTLRRVEVSFVDPDLVRTWAKQAPALLEWVDFTSVAQQDILWVRENEFLRKSARLATTYATDRWGRSAVHYAAYIGSLPLIELLVRDIGVFVDVICHKGLTPLHYLAEIGTHAQRSGRYKHLEKGVVYKAVKCLLEEGGANPFVRSHKREIPFFVACLKSAGEVVTAMLEVACDTAAAAGSGDAAAVNYSPGDTAVCAIVDDGAATTTSVETKECDHHGDTKRKGASDVESATTDVDGSPPAVEPTAYCNLKFYSDGWGPALAAVVAKDASILRLLIQFDIGLNHTNRCGATPLTAAVRLGFVEGVKMLLECGDQVNRKLGHPQVRNTEPRENGDAISALLAEHGIVLKQRKQKKSKRKPRR